MCACVCACVCVCVCVCVHVCVCIPVEFTDSSQPANIAPTARQDGQMVGVQCEEKTLSGELGF